MDYKIIRSNRKSLGLEIKPDGQVIVRAPMRLSEREIRRFVIQHEDWIRKHLEIVKQKQESRPEIERLTMQEIQ
ncbi:MAG: M48 family metallopeptidase, partial [Blautia sp.]|nr:M48 family metallopeptidase [Blautia sp.]